jgi:hypothetical protein
MPLRQNKSTSAPARAWAHDASVEQILMGWFSTLFVAQPARPCISVVLYQKNQWILKMKD